MTTASLPRNPAAQLGGLWPALDPSLPTSGLRVPLFSKLHVAAVPTSQRRQSSIEKREQHVALRACQSLVNGDLGALKRTDKGPQDVVAINRSSLELHAFLSARRFVTLRNVPRRSHYSGF